MCLAGGIGAGFGPGAGFARLGRGALGIALGGHGFAGSPFARGQSIGSLGPTGLGLVDFRTQLGALGCDFLGSGVGLGQFVLGGGLAFGQFGAALFGGFQTVPPAADLLGDLLRAPGAGFALAAQFVMPRPSGHHGHPRGFDRHLDIFDLGARGIEITQILHALFGLGQLLAGGERLFLVAGDGKTHRFQLGLRQIAVGLGPAEGAVGLIEIGIRGAARFAGLLVGLGQFGQFRTQGFMGM